MTVSTEILVLGAVTGLSYSLLAVGLVLVHRASRVVNFAYGEVGALAAVVLAELVLDHGWSFFPALAVAIAIGGAVGFVVEATVVRRLAGRSSIVVLVATIGVSQLLFAGQLLAPGVEEAAPFPVAFDWHHEIGGVLFRGEHFALLLFAPLALGGLTLFLRGTRTGLAIRGAADNHDAARLAGVPVRRVSSIVWVVSGMLAAATVVLINPLRGTIVGLPALALGPSVLLRAMAAALVGRLVSLPLAVVGGVLVGMVEATVLANVSSPGTVDAWLFVVVVVLVLVRGRAETMHGDGLLVPAGPRVNVPVRTIVGMLVAVAVALPWVFTQASDQFLLARMMLFALAGLSVVVVTGWGGHLSLCQFAFVGLGSMVTAGLEARGMPFGFAVLYGTAAGVVAAVAVGAPALRVRGLFLGVTTLAFAVAARGWLLPHDLFLGDDSTAFVERGRLLGLDLADQRTYYYLCLVVLAAALLAVTRLRARGPGRAILGVRENERAAASLTISPAATRIAAFAVAGGIAALAGGLLAGLRVQFGPSDFGPEESLALVGMVVIGGAASPWGSVAGAVYLLGVPALLGDSQEVRVLTSGIGLLVVLLVLPGGLLDGGRRLLAAVGGRGRNTRTADPPPSDAPLGRLRARDAAPADGPAAPALAVTDLTVRFGGVVAVDAVSLQVTCGEIVGLIGTNGAGKSTLIDAVAGFAPIEHGTVHVLGEDVTTWPAHERARLGMGRVFQDARLFGELTVEETVLLALEAQQPSELVPTLLGLGPSRRDERAKRSRATEVLGTLGLTGHARTPVRALSTGTRRIIELAVLVAVDARLVLLDEPAAGVAQREVEALAPLLADLRDRFGATVVLIEHDMPLVMSLSDRVVCLSAGRVIAEGTPDAVRRDPAVVSAYLGTDARVIDRSDLRRPTAGARGSTRAR